MGAGNTGGRLQFVVRKDLIDSGRVKTAADLKGLKMRTMQSQVYVAFMQSMGLVNDHPVGCHVTARCEELRTATVAAMCQRSGPRVER